MIPGLTFGQIQTDGGASMWTWLLRLAATRDG
jgi:hypothetical protein